MKFWLVAISWLIFTTCGVEDEFARHKFAFKKKVEKISYHYAKYKFLRVGFEDIDVVVKVETRDSKPQVMWVKDLTQTESVVEEAALSIMSGTAFSGKSEGEFGGVYTGTVDLAVDGTSSDCCSTMTFAPTIDPSRVFIGNQFETIAAEEWQALVEDTGGQNTSKGGQNTTGGQTAAVPEVTRIVLGPIKVGKVFRILTSVDVDRIEARATNGAIISDGLAQWKSLAGLDIFDVRGTNALFFTAAAIGKITKLVGLNSAGDMVLEASVIVARRDNDITVSAEQYSEGGYTWVAFSANPYPHPELPRHMLNIPTYRYISVNADSKVHDYHTGAIKARGYDSRRGIWLGLPDFDCPAGNKLLVMIRNDIYHGMCNLEGSIWEN